MERSAKPQSASARVRSLTFDKSGFRTVYWSWPAMPCFVFVFPRSHIPFLGPGLAGWLLGVLVLACRYTRRSRGWHWAGSSPGMTSQQLVPALFTFARVARLHRAENTCCVPTKKTQGTTTLFAPER